MNDPSTTVPCVLDPSEPAHVTAVHEAGHAVVGDRLGTTIEMATVRQAGPHIDGRVDQTPPGFAYTRALVDRLCALAGPTAELIFAGTAAIGECAQDEEIASSCTTALGEVDRHTDAARDLVARILAEPDIWLAVQHVACFLLEHFGRALTGPSVHELIESVIGPASSWEPTQAARQVGDQAK